MPNDWNSIKNKKQGTTTTTSSSTKSTAPSSNVKAWRDIKAERDADIEANRAKYKPTTTTKTTSTSSASSKPNSSYYYSSNTATKNTTVTKAPNISGPTKNTWTSSIPDNDYNRTVLNKSLEKGSTNVTTNKWTSTNTDKTYSSVGLPKAPNVRDIPKEVPNYDYNEKILSKQIPAAPKTEMSVPIKVNGQVVSVPKVAKTKYKAPNFMKSTEQTDTRDYNRDILSKQIPAPPEKAPLNAKNIPITSEMLNKNKTVANKTFEAPEKKKEEEVLYHAPSNAGLAEVVTKSFLKGATDTAANIMNMSYVYDTARTNPNQRPMMPLQATKQGAVQNAYGVGQRIASSMDYDNLSDGKKFVSGIVSSLPQMATNFVPGVGQGLFALSAAGGYAKQAQDSGANPLQQAVYGTIGGIGEVGLQEALDIIPGYKQLFAESGKATAGQFAKQAGKEAVEEMAIDPVMGLTEKLTYNPNKRWTGKDGVIDAQQILYDGLAGAVMSGALTSPAMVSHAVQLIQTKKMGPVATEIAARAAEEDRLPTEDEMADVLQELVDEEVQDGAKISAGNTEFDILDIQGDKYIVEGDDGNPSTVRTVFVDPETEVTSDADATANDANIQTEATEKPSPKVTEEAETKQAAAPSITENVGNEIAFTDHTGNYNGGVVLSNNGDGSYNVEYETENGKEYATVRKNGEDYVSELSKATTKEQLPMSERSIGNVGRKRSIKSYQYLHPELSPHIQQEANVLLGELQRAVKPERGGTTNRDTGSTTGFGHGRVAGEGFSEIRDTIGASYADIEKALRDIIKDHGAENYALAKKIEIIIDKRLTNGYQDDVLGQDIPPNKAYIKTKNAIESNIASKQNTPKEIKPTVSEKEDSSAITPPKSDKAQKPNLSETEKGDNKNAKVKDKSLPGKERRGFEQQKRTFERVTKNIKGFDGEVVKAETDVQKNIQKIMKGLGTEVVYYRSKSNQKLAFGMYNDGHTLYLNAGAKTENTIMHSAGHEFFHSVKENYPELFVQVLNVAESKGYFTDAAVNKFLKDFNPETQADLIKEYKDDIDLLHEEMLAEELGNNFVNRKFWDDIYETSKELFDKLVDIAREIIAKISGKTYGTFSEEAEADLSKEFKNMVKEIRARQRTASGKKTSGSGEADIKFAARGLKTDKDLQEFSKDSLKVMGLQNAVEKGYFDVKSAHMIDAIMEAFPDAWKEHMEIVYSNQEFSLGKDQAYGTAYNEKDKLSSTILHKKIGEMETDAKHIIVLFKGSNALDFVHQFGDFIYDRVLTVKQKKIIGEVMKTEGVPKSVFKNSYFGEALEKWWLKGQDTFNGKKTTKTVDNILFNAVQSIKNIRDRFYAIGSADSISKEIKSLIQNIVGSGDDIKKRFNQLKKLDNNYYYSKLDMVYNFLIPKEVKLDEDHVEKLTKAYRWKRQGFSSNAKTGWSYDPSSNCPKKEEFMKYMLRQIDKDGKTLEDLADIDYYCEIYDRAKAEGVTVPCEYCYVEDARRKALKYFKAGAKISGVNFSQAKQLYSTVPYLREILKFSKADVQKMNLRGGLRVFSFSDYVRDVHKKSITNVLEDAQIKNLGTKTITKQLTYVDDFGYTGANIQLSIDSDGIEFAGYNWTKNSNGSANISQGVKWDEAMRYSAEYPNVVVRSMAKNIDEVLAYLDVKNKYNGKPFISIITPFHGDASEYDGYEDMTSNRTKWKEMIKAIEAKAKKDNVPLINYLSRICCAEGGKCYNLKAKDENGDTVPRQCACNCGVKAGFMTIPNVHADKSNRSVNIAKIPGIETGNVDSELSVIDPYSEEAIDLETEDYSEETGIKFSARDKENTPLENQGPPTDGTWIKGPTFAEVKKAFPTLYESKKNTGKKERNPTQIATTASTYNQIYDYLDQQNFKGDILDASSGLGLGTKAGKDRGFNIDDVEPFPDEKYNPKYTSYADVDKKYDVIISNAVLNVIPQDTRDSVVKDIGRLLKDGGKAYIMTRGKDVLDSTNKIPINGEVGERNWEYFIPNKGRQDAYQKGFKEQELRGYVQEVLGDNFNVEIMNKNNGPFNNRTAVVVTKGAKSVQEPVTPPKKSPAKPKPKKQSAPKLVGGREVLKTLKGSAIKRSKYGVGKDVGGQIYVHKDYVQDVVPKEIFKKAADILQEKYPTFDFNTLMYDPKKNTLRFDEAPDFDTAREPIPGKYVSVNYENGTVKTGESDSIWHHKWQWVKDDYKGFDVDESYDWSKHWLSKLPEVAIGREHLWQKQLDNNNIEATYNKPDVRFSARNKEISKEELNDKYNLKLVNWSKESGFINKNGIPISGFDNEQEALEYAQDNAKALSQYQHPENVREDLNTLESELRNAKNEVAKKRLEKAISKLQGILTSSEKVDADILAMERSKSKKTSVDDIIKNINNYRLADIDSIAEQLFKNDDENLDNYYSMGTEERASWLKNKLKEIPPLQRQSKNQGFYVKPTDIKYSARNKQEESPEFKKWFGISRVRNEDGSPKVVYHGSGKVDFTKFDKDAQNIESLYGPGFYFTENPDIASSYTKSGNSKTMMRQGANEEERQMYFKPGNIVSGYGGSRDKVLSYTPQTKDHSWSVTVIEVDRNGKEIGYGPRRHFTNPSKGEVYKALNLRTEAQGMMPVYLKIENPIDVDTYPLSDEEIKTLGISELADIAREDKEHGIGRSKLKYGITLSDIYRVLASDRESYAEYFYDLQYGLQQLGFDGITHIGGNYAGNNTVEHRVWIAFEPNQIKSATGNGGEFSKTNDDIRFSAREKQEESPEFKKWFKDSKVVDEKTDEPLIVYHGTRSDEIFHEFNTINNDELGAHFGTQGAANEFVQNNVNDYPSRVYPVYLSIQNPLEMKDSFGSAYVTYRGIKKIVENDKDDRLYTDYEDDDDEWQTIKRRSNGMSDKELLMSIKQYLKHQGYDGIKYVNDQEDPGSVSWIAFEPNQIKSAIGNIGTFSPKNNDIRFSARDKEKYADPFVSKLAQVTEAKMSNSMKSTEYLKMLLGNGVKADEIKWTGLDDYLNQHEKVTKAEIQDFIKKNNVKITEIVKGDQLPDTLVSKVAQDIDWWFYNHVDRGRYDEADLSDIDRKLSNAIEAWEEEPNRENYEELEYRLRDWDLSLDKFVKKAKEKLGINTDSIEFTEHDDYVLPNGRNYKELLLTLPDVDGHFVKPEHWSEDKVVAFARITERMDTDLNNVLFVEEIQSDWHQEGRRKGYSDVIKELPKGYDVDVIYYKNGSRRYGVYKNEDQLVTGDTKELAIKAALKKLNENKIPNAPFSKTWHELMFKRVLRYAAEHGFDKIAWTTGDQQAKRYSLSKVVDQLNYNKSQKRLQGFKDGKTVVDKEIEPHKLADYVGKENSEQLLNSGDDNVTIGVNDEVGGKGMSGFYDKMLVDYANKYVKKWGTKVGTDNINFQEFKMYGKAKPDVQEVHSVDITPAMKKSVLYEGQPLFSARDKDGEDGLKEKSHHQYYNNDLVNEEIKNRVTEESKYYKPQTNSDQWDAAIKEVSESPLTVYSRLMRKKSFEDGYDTAKGEALLYYLQKEAIVLDERGFDDAAEATWIRAAQVLEKNTELLKKAGQTIQAASLFNKMTPQGQLRIAEKEIEKARSKRQINMMKEQSQKTAKNVNDITKNGAEAVIKELDEITSGKEETTIPTAPPTPKVEEVKAREETKTKGGLFGFLKQKFGSKKNNGPVSENAAKAMKAVGINYNELIDIPYSDLRNYAEGVKDKLTAHGVDSNTAAEVYNYINKNLFDNIDAAKKEELENRFDLKNPAPKKSLKDVVNELSTIKAPTKEAQKQAINKHIDTIIQKTLSDLKVNLYDVANKPITETLLVRKRLVNTLVESGLTEANAEKIGDYFAFKMSNVLKVSRQNGIRKTLQPLYPGSNIPKFSARTKMPDAAEIREIMVRANDKGIDVKGIIRGYFGSSQTDSVTEQFVNEGMDKKDAEALGMFVEKSFNKNVEPRLREYLEKEFKKIKVGTERQTYIDKVVNVAQNGGVTAGDLNPLVARKLGVPYMTPGAAKNITDMAERLQLLNPKTKEYRVLANELQDEIGQFAKASFLRKFNAVQTMGMLINPKSVGRNIIGNTVSAVMRQSDDLIATPFDMFLKLFTKKRTTSISPIGLANYFKGMGIGIWDTWTDFLLNQDSSAVSDRTEMPLRHTFNNPIGRFFENFMKLLMSDKPFSYARMYQVLAEQKRLAKKNKVEFNEDEALAIANYEAAYATFADDNIFTKAGATIQRTLNFGLDWGPGTFFIKFTKVPINVAKYGIHHTPYSAVKALVRATRDAFNHEGFNQRAFVDDIGKSVTGYGLIKLGAWLFKIGVISLSDPKDDKDKDLKAFKQSMGLGSFQFNYSGFARFLNGESTEYVDKDMLITYDWLQPISPLIVAGARYQEATGNEEKEKAASAVENFVTAIGKGVDSLMDQPFLQGLSQLKYEESMSDKFIAAGLSVPASFIPAVVYQARQLRDKLDRDTTGSTRFEKTKNMIMNRIPGLSEKLPAKYDSFGEEVPKYQDGRNTYWNVLFNPAYVTYFKSTPETQLLLDLYNNTGETKQLPKLAPTKWNITNRSYNIKDKEMTIVLTKEEQIKYQLEMGNKTKKKLSTYTVGTKTDEEVVGDIYNIVSDISNEIKDEILKERRIYRQPTKSKN